MLKSRLRPHRMLTLVLIVVLAGIVGGVCGFVAALAVVSDIVPPLKDTVGDLERVVGGLERDMSSAMRTRASAKPPAPVRIIHEVPSIAERERERQGGAA